MFLTEVQFGTDLGLIKTKAIKNSDGSFSLTGQKIFITYIQEMTPTPNKTWKLWTQ